jgi:hypothetical protein
VLQSFKCVIHKSVSIEYFIVSTCELLARIQVARKNLLLLGFAALKFVGKICNSLSEERFDILTVYRSCRGFTNYVIALSLE